MAQVAIVTDSVACLPKELVQSFNISIVPVYIHYQGKTYRDGVDISSQEVYQWLSGADKLPTTSAPPPQDFLEAFKKLADKSILCVTVSSKVSATFDAARLAKETAVQLLGKGDIEILDSKTACMAQGFLVLRAAEEAASGKSLEQILTKVNQLIPKVKMMGMLDTLYYLVKGGRVPKVVGWLTDFLQIKPIIGISNGEVGLIARARTRKKALQKMLEIIERSEGDALYLAIHYTDNPAWAEELKKELLKLKPKEIYLTPFSPAMGVHVGTGFVGLAFYKD